MPVVVARVSSRRQVGKSPPTHVPFVTAFSWSPPPAALPPCTRRALARRPAPHQNQERGHQATTTADTQIPARVAATRPSPALTRWFELQNATLNLRYRFIDTSAGTITTNQLQHRETIRGRVKFDTSAKYTWNFGVFTGTRFTSG